MSHKFYDQIAWFEDQPGVYSLNPAFRGAGHSDFLPYLSPDLSKEDVEWETSGHLPLWVQFGI